MSDFNTQFRAIVYDGVKLKFKRHGGNMTPHTRFRCVHWKYGSRRGDSTGYITPVHWCCRTTNDLVARKSQGYVICASTCARNRDRAQALSMQAYIILKYIFFYLMNTWRMCVSLLLNEYIICTILYRNQR